MNDSNDINVCISAVCSGRF